MAIFLTGSTGYIGAHVSANLLDANNSLNLLVRAPSIKEAKKRLWRSLQLHLDFPTFLEYQSRHIEIFLGDLTLENLGLDEAAYHRLMQTTNSIIHCAASLNRKSEKTCLNVNLRGTLEIIQLANKIHAHHGLRRFSHVSTVAVAGMRQNELVSEDSSVDWSKSDYDPYARTKKFCEHMVKKLLPKDVSRIVFRPSIVLGDSRYGETTQFEMVRSFVFLAGLRFLPIEPSYRIDIVPVEFVAKAISTLHCREKPKHDIYQLSSGEQSETFCQLTEALCKARHKRRPLYVPWLESPFRFSVNFFANRRNTSIGTAAALLKVFLPYLYWDTVFDNKRIVEEMGEAPKAFSKYCYPLLKFSTENAYQYKYLEWPTNLEGTIA